MFVIHWLRGATSGSSSSPADTGDENKKHRLSQLDRHDVLLFEKLVDSLSTMFTPGSDSDKARTIVFRQSESWTKVEALLNDVDITSSPQVKKWVKGLREHIDLLRGAKKTIKDMGQSILKRRKELKDTVPSLDKTIANYLANIDVAEKSIDGILTELFLDLLYARPRKTVEKSLKAIAIPGEGLVHDWFEKFNANEDDSVSLNEECCAVAHFILKNWRHLTVFTYCWNVPMDSAGLCVQIEKKQGCKIGEKEHEKKGKFLVEKGDKKISLIDYDIGPSSQSACTSTYTTPTSTKVVLQIARVFQELARYNCLYVEDSHPEAKKSPPLKSSLGDRLHKIVVLALAQVNDQLACQSLVKAEPATTDENYPLIWRYL